jgi:hypothetical protein
MQATKPKEQAQDLRHKDSRQQNIRLDARYGKIGISAVAAAVRHQGEQCNRHETRQPPAERD